MSRSLALFGIGLVFGGGVGFLIAAANGVTLDGHDHSSATGHDAHAAMKHGDMKKGHGKHGELLQLPEGTDVPTLDIAVKPDPMSGWNLHIVTDKFRFSPENASAPHVAGEGHAHIYLNGKKVARHYGPWFHIAEMPKGKNTVKVTLNANDHRALGVAGKPLEASISVDVD